MRFIYADSLDFVDPEYDFEADRTHKGRRSHRDDEYPHEFLKYAPYDGILVSRGIVGDVRSQGKYTESQLMRFRRDGARAFLRYPDDKYPGSMLIGDCGAFTYAKAKVPPYGAADTVDFYGDAEFTHGCSVDHIIFDFDESPGRTIAQVSKDTRDRYEITLSLAADFFKASRVLGRRFTPLGVVQGWSADSMASAAKSLVKIGYSYLAVGGLVPLKSHQIHEALAAIRDAIPSKVKLHLLGFGKIEQLPEFSKHKISSFDTTSPLLRAFKDAKKNYFSLTPEGDLTYYTAIRIPQATLNKKLKQKAMEGRLDQEMAVKMEGEALAALRSYANRKVKVDDALEPVMAYWATLDWHDSTSDSASRRRIDTQRAIYKKTLSDRPWERCNCRVCHEGGIEAVIFRASNRNKRRGIHNLHVFYQQLLEHRKDV